MAEQLAGIRGRFKLSLNDRPEVRETFAGFTMRAIATTYTVARSTSAKAAELLISNGPLPLADND